MISYIQTKIFGGRIKVETEGGVTYIPEPYYFRESPSEEIMAQGVEFFYNQGIPGFGRKHAL